MGLDFEGEEEGGDFDNRDRISILEHPLKRSSIIAGYSKSNDKYGDQSILNAELERLYEEIYNENKDHKSQGNLYRASSSKRGENVTLKKKKFWNFHPKEEQRSVQSYQSKKRGHEKKKISASERASVGNTFGSHVFESGYGNGNLVSQKMANYGSLDNEATENYLFARKNFEEDEIFSDNILDFNPHWEDMITFRESRLKRQKSRTWSESDVLISIESKGNTVEERLQGYMDRAIGRFVILVFFPVLVVLLWVSLPIKSHLEYTNDGTKRYKADFYFFLFVYFGIYNAISLALVTRLFHIYSLNWWPESMSAVSANTISWLLAVATGALVYRHDPSLVQSPLLWMLLTQISLLLPLIMSMIQIQRNYRKTSGRKRLVEEDALFHSELEWRTPSSYRRFFWFCLLFLFWYAALMAGEFLGYTYVNTIPHTNFAGLIFLYAWILIVNSLDVISSWIITEKVRSWPLEYAYQLYFTLTYFVFYRNIFARLKDPKQYVYIQLLSSLFIVLLIPLRMCSFTYKILLHFGFVSVPYKEYKRNLALTFYIRNLAENSTMLAFLIYINILHYGLNQGLYPYFQFKPTDDEPEYHYSFDLTRKASCIIWISELIVSHAVSLVSIRLFDIDIVGITVSNLKRYPHIIPVIILLTIHVLQNILFALFNLDFY